MTTNAELIAEAVEDALFCWAGEGLPDAQFIASRVTAALESATTVTDEMVERSARAAFDDAFLKHAPADVDRWDDLDPVDERGAIDSWREVARAALTAALTEGERR